MAILASTLVSGFFSDFFGRKKALIIGQVVMLLGWVVVYFATSFGVLLSGRCITGLGIGIAYPTICMYLCEIALIRLRGTMAVMNTIMTNASFIYSLLFSATLSLQGKFQTDVFLQATIDTTRLNPFSK